MTQEISHESEELIELNRQENEAKLEIEKLRHEIKLLKSELGLTGDLTSEVPSFIKSVDLSSPEVTLRPLLAPSDFSQYSIENKDKQASSERGTVQNDELPVIVKSGATQTPVSEKQVIDKIPKQFIQNLSLTPQEETILLSIQGQKLLEIDHQDSRQKIILEFHPHQVEIRFPNGTEFKLPLEKL